MSEPTLKSYSREIAMATATLAGIAILAALYFGRVVFMPIVLALVLSTVLRPLVRWLESVRVPAPAGAALVVVAVFATMVVAVYELTPSVRRFARQLPEATNQAHRRLAELPPPFNALADEIPVVDDTTARRVAGQPDSTGAVASVAPQRNPVRARLQSEEKPVAPSTGPPAGRVFSNTTQLLIGFLQTMLLVGFFLAGGNIWRRKILRGRGPNAPGRGIIEIGDAIQSCVSRYLVITAALNLAQGVLVGVVAWAVGLPTPAIWGMLTFVAEFFPYLGGISMVVLLTLVGLSTSRGFGHALIAPVLYLVITTVQNNLLSPILYGRGLELNPAAILVSVIVWWFIWGTAGGFLAVPILAMIRIICERAGENLAPVAELIHG
jgi:predicted PurR-regulated permease PerM